MNDHHNSIAIFNAADKAVCPPIKAPCTDWGQVLEKAKANKNRAGVLAKEFINQVDKNFREQHSPLFYATKMDITKSYLRKICQRAIGIPPSHCIQARLMLEAFELLKSLDFSIKEVASIIGFEDASHFSRFFKGHSGLSPECYRNFYLKNA